MSTITEEQNYITIQHITSVKAEKKVRKSCDACSKAKKKCDSNMPCSCCIRWGVPCVYSHKLRPGPVPKHSLSNFAKTRTIAAISSPQTGDVFNPQVSIPPPPGNNRPITEVENTYATESYSPPLAPPSPLTPQEIFTVHDLEFAQFHLRHNNATFPFLSNRIYNLGISGLTNNQHYNNSQPEVLASIVLLLCSCGLSASFLSSAQAAYYLNLAQRYWELIVDDPCDLSVRACLAMEIYFQICSPDMSTMPREDRQYRLHAENLMSQCSSQLTEVTLLLLDHLKLWESEFTSCKPVEFTISGYDVSSLSPPIQVPSYCIHISHTWFKYLYARNNTTHRDLITNAVDGEHKGKMLTHTNELTSDIQMLHALIESGNNTTQQDHLSYTILRLSISLHHIFLKQPFLYVQELIQLCSYVINHHEVISTPHMWHWIRLVLQILYQSSLIETNVYCLTIGRMLIHHKLRLCKYDITVGPTYLTEYDITELLANATGLQRLDGQDEDALVHLADIAIKQLQDIKASIQVKKKSKASLDNFASLQSRMPDASKLLSLSNSNFTTSPSSTPSLSAASLKSVNLNKRRLEEDAMISNKRRIEDIRNQTTMTVSQLTLKHIAAMLDLTTPLPWDSPDIKKAHQHDSSYDDIIIV